MPANRLFDLNNPYASFKVECWDYESNDPHQFIGEIFVSSMDLKNKPSPIEYPMNSSHLKKPGFLTLEGFQMVSSYNFVDYLKSGLHLNLAIGIDFTGTLQLI